MSHINPLLSYTVPLYPAGQEPLPPGLTEDDREAYNQQQRMQKWIGWGMESCIFKTGMAGGGGLAIGAFFSLMSSSFAYEDPLLRAQMQSGMTTTQKASEVFKEMGRNMWRSGRGFAKIGMLFSGIECCIESYRARNDMYNPVSAGFVAGAILARNSGPRASLGGGAAFAAFSALIDLYLRREMPDDD